MKITIDSQYTKKLGAYRTLVLEYIRLYPKACCKEIAYDLGLSEMGVRNAVKTLEEMRYIKRYFSNPNSTRKYWIDTEVLK